MNLSPQPARALAVLAFFFLVIAALPFAAPPARADYTAFLPSALSVSTGTFSGSLTDLGSADGAGITITEAGAGPGADIKAWLKPNADGAVVQWRANDGCTAGLEYTCVDDTPVHDGNTTIINAFTLSSQEMTFTDWAAPVGVSIDSVQIFTVARRNASSGTSYSVNLQTEDKAFICLPILTLTGPTEITQAFANYSSLPYATDCRNGDAWSVAEVNDLLLTHVDNGNFVLTTTATGLIVQYDDVDYSLSATLTFTGLPTSVSDAYLAIESALTDTGDTFSLEAQDCSGGFVKIADLPSGTDPSVTSFICGTGATFRIVDVDLTGNDQAALLLDWFQLFAQPTPAPPPPDPDRYPIGGIVSCTIAWPWDMAIRCRARELMQSGLIVTRLWYVDGDLAQRTDADPVNGTSLYVPLTGLQSKPWVPLNVSHAITYRIVLFNGQVFDVHAIAAYDSTLLIVFYGAIIAVAAMAWASRRRHREPDSEPPKRGE